MYLSTENIIKGIRVDLATVNMSKSRETTDQCMKKQHFYELPKINRFFFKEKSKQQKQKQLTCTFTQMSI